MERSVRPSTEGHVGTPVKAGHGQTHQTTPNPIARHPWQVATHRRRAVPATPGKGEDQLANELGLLSKLGGRRYRTEERSEKPQIKNSPGTRRDHKRNCQENSDAESTHTHQGLQHLPGERNIPEDVEERQTGPYPKRRKTPRHTVLVQVIMPPRLSRQTIRKNNRQSSEKFPGHQRRAPRKTIWFSKRTLHHRCARHTKKHNYTKPKNWHLNTVHKERFQLRPLVGNNRSPPREGSPWIHPTDCKQLLREPHPQLKRKR